MATPTVKVLKRYLIEDKGRYAKDMGTDSAVAQDVATRLFAIVARIEKMVLQCDAAEALNIEAAIDQYFPMYTLKDYSKRAINNIKGDAYLFKIVEDLWRRVRLAYFNEAPPDFNNVGGSKCGQPWIVTDTNAYAYKWRLDIPGAIDICNLLIELNTAISKNDTTNFGKHYNALLNYDLSAYDMTHLQRVQLKEDIYSRVRYMILKSCVTLDTTTDLDQQAQMLLFYQQHRKMENAANRCA